VGSIENRLRRLEEKAAAQEPEYTPAFVKMVAVLDELAALRGSGAVHYRGGVPIEPEDIPGRTLGPGHTYGQLYALAAERASAKAGAEVFPLEDVPAAVEALVALHEAHGGDPGAVADRGA
jgi:hypothetical protein